MSTTVNEAFLKFNKDFVNLDPEVTKDARASRKWLLDQLKKLPATLSDFPLLYDEKHVNYGSFARNTKIRELDDIDIIIGIHAQGSTYELIVHGEEYIIKPPHNIAVLQNLCNEDGTLNSIKFVNKIVSSLNSIPQYQSSEKHRRQEAATLNLSSYTWSYDIVPAFFTNDTLHYLIPDGLGRWKATHPDVDQAKVNRINQKHGGKVLQLIRTLKYWNRRAMMTTIPSYLFENIVLDYFDAQAPIGDFIDLNMRDFWFYLSQGIHFPVSDPKGFQGDLNTLTTAERNGIATKALETYKKAIEAIHLETVIKNQTAAINKWAEIFGSDFE